MRALIQRVTRAEVAVAGEVIGQIGPGLMVLVCAMQGDADDAAQKLAARVARLRIFRDEAGKMNRSVQNLDGNGVHGGLLIVSQFTLAADTNSGTRASFTPAAAPDLARVLYDDWVKRAQAKHSIVQTGEFAADMQVSLVNDGPVTFWLQVS